MCVTHSVECSPSAYKALDSVLNTRQAWRSTPVIPAHERQKQEGYVLSLRPLEGKKEGKSNINKLIN